MTIKNKGRNACGFAFFQYFCVVLTIDQLRMSCLNGPIGGKTRQNMYVHQRMLHDLKFLLQEVEAAIGKKITLSSDFEKLARLFSSRGLNITESALKGVWNHVGMKEKPSKATLDVLALFAGFQSWDDFKLALHGQNNGDLEGDDCPKRVHHS